MRYRVRFLGSAPPTQRVDGIELDAIDFNPHKLSGAGQVAKFAVKPHHRAR
jgi:hypothetical protein